MGNTKASGTIVEMWEIRWHAAVELFVETIMDTR